LNARHGDEHLDCREERANLQLGDPLLAGCCGPVEVGDHGDAIGPRHAMDLGEDTGRILDGAGSRTASYG
jgi:hypothetical protein